MGARPKRSTHYRALALATGATAESRSRHSQALRLARKISSAKDEADATYQFDAHPGKAGAHFRQALALYQAQD